MTQKEGENEKQNVKEREKEAKDRESGGEKGQYVCGGGNKITQKFYLSK